MKLRRIPVVIALVVLASRAFDATAQTETDLHSFVGYPADGDAPEAGLVQGSDGNFYGTTEEGGSSTNCSSFGCGTVFRIGADGTETNLHSFAGPPDDGRSPQSGLVQGTDGNFYGTTTEGGSSTNCAGGCGTVFRISPSGTYTTLYSFVGSPKDGALPYATLVQASDGNFYGTTVEGGSSTNCGAFGCGTVFRITPDGTETNLHSFAVSPKDGQSPYAGLVLGSDSNFYGVTYEGGANTNCFCGTVFKITPSGAETNLYSFAGYPKDGAAPYGGLVRGGDGNFYGTAVEGGTSGFGTVFRITSGGAYSNLFSFAGYPTDGDGPGANLVQGSDGNLYGTTVYGGTNATCSCGTVFRISPGGSLTNLYSFANYPDDGQAVHGLVQGSDGSFYGMTSGGGTNNNGIVFKFSVPLNPPANQISRIETAGTNVVLAIPSVAGETYQLQFTTDLTSGIWSNVPVSLTNSIGSILTLTNFAGADQPQGFYRFAITP